MAFQKSVLVVPVGFEEDRAVFGLLQLGASKIYLLLDEKQDPWGDEARRHTGKVKEKIAQMMFDMNNLVEVRFDPTSYESCEKTVKTILEDEIDSEKVYLNISSSTKLCAVAFALKAIEYKNAFLYYVVPQNYNLPNDGLPFSYGAQRIEVFTPRDNIFNEIERTILENLNSQTFSSLGELNKAIIPDDISKASKAKLSYYVRKLQDQGLIDFSRGTRIAITLLGKSKLIPPTDNAQRTPIVRVQSVSVNKQ